jgi:hypothetical protein
MNTKLTMLKLWVCVGVVLAVGVGAMAQTEEEAELATLPGSITSVTVYRDKALITREITVEVSDDDMDFIVTDLPEQIISSSLYATADGALIQGVTYFVDETVEASPAPELPQMLIDKIQELELSIQVNQQKLQLLQQEEAYLAQLQNVSTNMPNMFSATTRDADDSSQVTTFAPDKAMEMFEYMFEKRAAIGAKKIELTTESTELNRQVQLARQEIAQFQKDNPATGREFDRRALVSLTGTTADTVTVYLNYLVQKVNWSPTYTARAVTGNDSIRLDYDAFVFQQTGEDWTDVDLTLSTASPEMWSEPPVLKPLWMDLTTYQVPIGGGADGQWVTAATGNVGMDIGSASMAGARLQDVEVDLGRERMKEELAAQMTSRLNVNSAPMEQVEVDRSSTLSPVLGYRASQVVVRKQVAQIDYSINDLANRLQALDIVVGDGNGLVPPVASTQGTISLEYELAGTVSVPSRPEQMMVKVDELELTGGVVYVAVPLLTNQVFREAELTNTSAVALLPGPINSYLDEKFVGSGDLASLVSQGEEFALGFGVDSQLETHRRLVERTETESWGNIQLICEYEIGLTNYKDDAVTVLVKDRLPNVEDTEIELQGFTSSESLSTDAYFVEYLKPLGMLRWSVEVPASAQRADVKALTYEYTLEYDKDMHISLPSATESNKRELKTLSSKRFTRW